MKTLLIDSNFICHQARYTMPTMTNAEETPTEVTYGFLKRILYLGKEFNTNRFIFCWDSRKSFRKKLFPFYKENRRSKEKCTREEKIDKSAYIQFTLLRTDILPTIGFHNNLLQTGIESDDIIASLLENNDLEEPVIVSSDEDMFQLLDKADMFSPSKRKYITKDSFKSQYGIDPGEWVDVKAIAGCKSDNVPGVSGVGEQRVLRYLNGELKECSQSYKKIVEFERSKHYRMNLRLVGLPFEKTKVFDVNKDFVTFDKKAFMELCLEHDFNSFIDNLGQWARIFGREFK